MASSLGVAGVGSVRAWRDARRHLAGGVNSPVRAFRAVGGTPVFVRAARGAHLWDLDGRRYVDFCLSWGALIFGHADSETLLALCAQAKRGTTYGIATRLETRLAAEIKKAFPRIERLRFTSSGTEAVMSAVRLARGLTRRDRIVKFEGCYHGHADSLLVKAGSGLASFGSPNSDGVPRPLARLTSVLPYNDAEAVRRFFARHRDVACVVVEPVAGNMGVVPAREDFLETLRRETKRTGSFLIFDEVISGFRVGYGGAQHLYGIEPDLTVLGKIIGGGLPIGAFGGPASAMRALAPEGRVYQAGTLSGNPVSMAAGLSVLSRLNAAFYRRLSACAASFLKEAGEIFRRKRVSLQIQSAGSMFTFFFSEGPVSCFRDVARQNHNAFKRFFRTALAHGVYWPPSMYESSFLSAAHREEELSAALRVFERCR